MALSASGKKLKTLCIENLSPKKMEEEEKEEEEKRKEGGREEGRKGRREVTCLSY